MSKSITIRLNNEEELMMDKLAKMYDCGISTALKRLALEKLEDEYDMKVAEKFEKDLIDGKVKFVPQEEFNKIFKL